MCTMNESLQNNGRLHDVRPGVSAVVYQAVRNVGLCQQCWTWATVSILLLKWHLSKFNCCGRSLKGSCWTPTLVCGEGGNRTPERANLTLTRWSTTNTFSSVLHKHNKCSLEFKTTNCWPVVCSSLLCEWNISPESSLLAELNMNQQHISASVLRITAAHTHRWRSSEHGRLLPSHHVLEPPESDELRVLTDMGTKGLPSVVKVSWGTECTREGTALKMQLLAFVLLVLVHHVTNFSLVFYLTGTVALKEQQQCYGNDSKMRPIHLFVLYTEDTRVEKKDQSSQRTAVPNVRQRSTAPQAEPRSQWAVISLHFSCSETFFTSSCFWNKFTNLYWWKQKDEFRKSLSAKRTEKWIQSSSFSVQQGEDRNTST